MDSNPSPAIKDEIIESYKKAIIYGQKIPYNKVALGRFYGKIFFSEKNPQLFVDAVDLFNAALKQDPCNYKFYYELGTFYGNLGNYQEAQMNLKKSIELYPYFPEAYFNLAVACLKMNNMAEARENAEKALKLNPEFEKAKILIEHIKE